jgi:hypothetical protein
MNNRSFRARSTMLSAASNSAHRRHSHNDSVIRHKRHSHNETEWHESPWNDAVKLTSERTRLPNVPGMNAHVGIRRQNTSPNHIREYPDEKTSNLINNWTPPQAREQRRQPSPYVVGKMNHARRAAERLPDSVLPWKALVDRQSRRGLSLTGQFLHQN